MLQSWNKFCFTGGYIEVSLRLPGSGAVGGFWPGEYDPNPSYSSSVLTSSTNQVHGRWAISVAQDMLLLQTASGPSTAFPSLPVLAEADLLAFAAPTTLAISALFPIRPTSPVLDLPPLSTRARRTMEAASLTSQARSSRLAPVQEATIPAPTSVWVEVLPRLISSKRELISLAIRQAGRLNFSSCSQVSWTGKEIVGSVSQSAQFAPYDDGYQFKNTTGYVEIYDEDQTYLNEYLVSPLPADTRPSSALTLLASQGGVYQQAVSGVTYTNPEAYADTGDQFSLVSTRLQLACGAPS